MRRDPPAGSDRRHDRDRGAGWQVADVARRQVRRVGDQLAERGIDVSEERSAKTRDYTSLVTVAVDDVQVSGTIIGPEHRHFLAGALGFAIDLQLSPRMVFFRYDDIPGVIGRVGTMFGEAGVNIANMAVSRTKEGGKALMALAIDSDPPPELVARIRGEGFDDARFITV